MKHFIIKYFYKIKMSPIFVGSEVVCIKKKYWRRIYSFTYIYLHCVMSLLWSAKTLDTLIYVCFARKTRRMIYPRKLTRHFTFSVPNKQNKCISILGLMKNLLKVRQSWNDFVKTMFLPKNENNWPEPWVAENRVCSGINNFEPDQMVFC